MWFVLKALFTAGMSSKETRVKVYRDSSPSSAINSSSCRLCRATGDPNHRKNLFKPSNRALLGIAEQICGHPIVYEANLPHLLCRPCERRLKNTMTFQKIIVDTEQSFRQSSQTRFKRCANVSPSISQRPRSRQATSTVAAPSTRHSARTSLSFESYQEPTSVNRDIEVSTRYSLVSGSIDIYTCFSLSLWGVLQSITVNLFPANNPKFWWKLACRDM